MQIRSGQMNQMTAAWRRHRLMEWLAWQFPDSYYRWSPQERDAYIESRTALALSLGFTDHHHLRFLIGYELGCGVVLVGEDEAAKLSMVRAILMQPDLAPAKRIEAVERLLYGEPDNGS